MGEGDGTMASNGRAGVSAVVVPLVHPVGPRVEPRIKVGTDGRQLRACGAVRISEDEQSVWSATTQRAAILARAHADGYAMDDCDIFEDHARGHVVTRQGYQSIL